MTTVLGDKLKEALENVKPDITTYTWKLPKDNEGNQETIRLVDCSNTDLLRYYNQCKEMLYNKSNKNPGRYTLIDIVSNQIQRCRAELLVRWLKTEKNYTNQRCYEDIKNVIKLNDKILTDEAIETYPIGQIYNGIPVEFENVPIKLVLDACLDKLGVADLSHLTINFIIKMGIWLTPQELTELTRKDPFTGKVRNRADVICEELRLKDIKLAVKSTGLSYAEFKTMINLKRGVMITHNFKQAKYSNLTTDQLRLLSNKVLYRFQERCEDQAKRWKELIQQISEIVATRNA